jgi:hypothetical protein
MSGGSESDDDDPFGLGRLATVLNEIEPPAAPKPELPPEVLEEKPIEPEAPADPNSPN